RARRAARSVSRLPPADWTRRRQLACWRRGTRISGPGSDENRPSAGRIRAATKCGPRVVVFRRMRGERERGVSFVRFYDGCYAFVGPIDVRAVDNDIVWLILVGDVRRDRNAASRPARTLENVSIAGLGPVDIARVDGNAGERRAVIRDEAGIVATA